MHGRLAYKARRRFVFGWRPRLIGGWATKVHLRRLIGLVRTEGRLIVVRRRRPGGLVRRRGV